MPVAVIADCHIGGPGGPAGPLVEQLDELAAEGCERLVLLGDLFHVWIGSRRFENRDIREVTAAIARLGERGVPVDYVEGNRDFFLQHGVYARLFERLGPEIAFQTGGRRYLAVHGDGLDPTDRSYLFWRRLSKNRLSRALAFALPPRLTLRFAMGTERRLADSNFKHKVRIPRQVIGEFAERRLAEGHEILLLGHYHRPRSWRVAGGEVRLLDAWFNDRKIHWVGRRAGE